MCPRYLYLKNIKSLQTNNITMIIAMQVSPLFEWSLLYHSTGIISNHFSIDYMFHTHYIIQILPSSFI